MRIYSLFFMIILVTLSNAQSKVIKANGDYIKLDNKNDNKIKYGSNILLEIEGLNPFITKSIVEYKPINYDFSTEAFTKINLIEKPEIREIENIPSVDKVKRLAYNINQISKNISNLSKTQSILSENNQNINQTEIDQLKLELIKMQITNEEYLKEIKNLNKLTATQKQEIEKILAIDLSKENFLKDFKTFQLMFDKINNYSNLKSLLANQIKNTPIFIENINLYKKNAISTLISTGTSDVEIIKKDIIVQLDNIIDMYKNLNANYQKINDNLKKKSFDFTGDLKDGNNILKVKNLKADIEIKYFFEDEMKKVKAIHDSLSLPKYKNKIIKETLEGCDLFTFINDNDYKKTLSSPFIYDDKAEIEFNIKNDKEEVVFTYPKLTVKTYNQLKINGSAGYFINFIGDDLYDLYKNKDDTNTYLRESKTSKFKHALGGLLHAYYNLSPSIGVGLSVGLSINDDSNVGFYLGGSLFLTENNRLVLTSGVSFIKVDRLNTNNLLINNNNLYYFNDDSFQIVYNKVYESSFFIGVTYNLF